MFGMVFKSEGCELEKRKKNPGLHSVCSDNPGSISYYCFQCIGSHIVFSAMHDSRALFTTQFSSQCFCMILAQERTHLYCYFVLRTVTCIGNKQ